MTLDILFNQLREIRPQVQVPVILMGYFNPVLQYGVNAFCEAAAEAGVSGVIIPDLPSYEYEKLYMKLFRKHNLHFIFLVTPGISKERLKQADKSSSGFLYAVSSAATTGRETPEMNTSLSFLDKVKLKNPVMVGFGIKDKAGFEAACAHADGAIIGSAFIKALQKDPDIKRTTADFIKNIRP